MPKTTVKTVTKTKSSESTKANEEPSVVVKTKSTRGSKTKKSEENGDQDEIIKDTEQVEKEVGIKEKKPTTKKVNRSKKEDEPVVILQKDSDSESESESEPESKSEDDCIKLDNKEHDKNSNSNSDSDSDSGSDSDSDSGSDSDSDWGTKNESKQISYKKPEPRKSIISENKTDEKEKQKQINKTQEDFANPEFYIDEDEVIMKEKGLGIERVSSVDLLNILFVRFKNAGNPLARNVISIQRTLIDPIGKSFGVKNNTQGQNRFKNHFPTHGPIHDSNPSEFVRRPLGIAGRGLGGRGFGGRGFEGRGRGFEGRGRGFEGRGRGFEGRGRGFEGRGRGFEGRGRGHEERGRQNKLNESDDRSVDSNNKGSEGYGFRNVPNRPIINLDKRDRNDSVSDHGNNSDIEIESKPVEIKPRGRVKKN